MKKTLIIAFFSLCFAVASNAQATIVNPIGDELNILDFDKNYSTESFSRVTIYNLQTLSSTMINREDFKTFYFNQSEGTYLIQYSVYGVEYRVKYTKTNY